MLIQDQTSLQHKIGNVTTIRALTLLQLIILPMVFKYLVEHQQFIILLLPALGLQLHLSPGIFEQDYTGSFSITGLDDSNVLSGNFVL